ncbi:phage terminase small subunit [Cupriavidus nantongensis]|uniref:phage terminase small subunit n=1 Tax=Cupriavidus nantongensis TaxID=1796606 RepID=UPI0009EE19C9|nr:phage terminase small subunit [Cupriavidus nantongensis]
MSKLSPALRHQARVRAELAAAHAEPESEMEGSAYDLMMAQLIEHRRRLKAIQSIEQKIKVKREILPVYDEWVNGVLAAGNGAQDNVLTTVLVWYIDVGDFARALDIAAYALRHNLKLPDQYDRNLATMLLDEIPGAYLAGKIPAEPAPEILAKVGELTQDFDAPDQARAKLFKAFGYAQLGKVNGGDTDISQVALDRAEIAIVALRRALELFEGVGVKKDIERLERRLKDSKPADIGPESPPEGNAAPAGEAGSTDTEKQDSSPPG